jgi:hypothetical protein
MAVSNVTSYVLARKKYYKWTYASWTQPVLSANGTVGGSSYAARASSNYSGHDPWKAFNGTNINSDDCWEANTRGESEVLEFYSPDTLKLSAVKFTNRRDNYVTVFNPIMITGSMDGVSYFTIGQITPPDANEDSQYTFYVPSTMNKHCKYIRFHQPSGGSLIGNTSARPSFGRIEFTAQKVTGVTAGTTSDYDYIENIPYFLCRKVSGKTVPYALWAKKNRVVKTFNVSGDLQTFIVPETVMSISIDCVASAGSTSEDGTLAGGKGGRVKCTLKVTPGQTLYFMVGGKPSNAATVTYNASDIRIGGTEYSNRVLVAGGGGSAAWRNGHGATGGAGGGTTGGAGVQDTTGSGAAPGQGGTQSAGGSGGAVNVSGSVWGSPGGDGQLGLGGTSDNHSYHNSIGGVGGAGYYGGGGGAGFHTSSTNRASGGGGGSSYANSSYCTNVVHTQGYNSGIGYITIEFLQEI